MSKDATTRKDNRMTSADFAAEFLSDLSDSIQNQRERLITEMRLLAENLLSEADTLESCPDRRPNSLGYVANTSLSRDIDNDAVRLCAQMDSLREAALVLRRIAKSSK